MAWIWIGFQAAELPDGTLHSSKSVAVEPHSEGGWRFQPSQPAPDASTLIFLPGGMVEPVAYAPLLRAVAEAGYPAVLLPLPWRCACTEAQRRRLFDAIGAEASRGPVVLAGHSRGAALAARYVSEHANQVQGVVLMATVHPRDFSLAGLTIPITRIYGSNDGVAKYSSMRANAHLLPVHTQWVRIEGGNHVQFGFYRHQLMAGEATIPRDQQQRQILTALIAALKEKGPTAVRP